MIDQSANATVVVFGRGEVSVKNGKHDTTNYPFISFRNCEPANIGDLPGKVLPDSPSVKLVFLNKESLDVVLSQLTEAREAFDETKHQRSEAF